MTGPGATAQLGGLARHLRGRVMLPGDRDWDAARQPWNRRVDQRPAAVVEAEVPDDMAATVAFASRYGLRVTVQSSGHGAGDTLEDTILLRTGRLREITVDPGRALARVGAGVRCDELMAAISPHGLAASVGSARDTGVAGYAMFGGVGVLGRSLGFMANQIAAVEAVTADGSPVRCDAATHPDLWWALRGGGGGFALVTRLELRLARLPDLFGGQIAWPLEAAPEVMHAWRCWTQSLPPEMTSSAIVVQLPPLPEVPGPLRGQRVTVVNACYAGPAAEGDSLLRPLTRTAAPLFSSCRPLASADLAMLSGAPAAPLPARIRAELLEDLPGAAVDTFVRHGSLEPGSPLMLAEIRHLGGAYARPRGNDGAIGRTTARYLLELVGLTPAAEADAAVQEAEQAMTSALARWTTGTILPGFAEPASVTDARRVFPPETRRRLARVKRRYDPGNVLRASFPL
jgi:hypothetical protein